ncbi:AAA family ATPase [Thermomonas fusca]|uniref:ATPase AAA-type core domain-containing protein n=1 Tax=Thermomonas fusca TaxID=215690 RepID=A0A5R9PGN9_9GAMM|nr:AAA family ATPase [Thermomonas fusca]TLX22635.1 hypothetical protein E5S66_00985 [Thermomonas fusca]
MPTYIYADNYRGFKGMFFALKQVNFLVGENSTGKSSILELIENLADVNFWAFHPEFGGEFTPRRHFSDLVSLDSPSKRSFTIGAISITKTKAESVHGMLVTYINNDGRPFPSKISVISDNCIRTVEGNFSKSKGDMLKAYEKTFNRATTCKDEVDRLQAMARAHATPANPKTFNSPRVGVPLLLRFSEQLHGKDAARSLQQKFRAPSFSRQFVELAPIRTKPKRTYDSPETPFSPEGDHTPYVIRKRLSSKTGKEFKEFMHLAGADSGLFRTLSVREYSPEDRAPFEIRVNLDKGELTLDNVGYGVSQALPLLVEIFVQPKGSTFAIQQPEVHLHPRAQAAFGDVIASIARVDGKQFLIETHSDFTIDRFRMNVKKSGNIESQILFFERSAGNNKITAIDIKEDGSIGEDQPESYREFFLNESLANL